LSIYFWGVSVGWFFSDTVGFFWMISSLSLQFLMIECSSSLGVSLTLLSPVFSFGLTSIPSTILKPLRVYIKRLTSPPINDFSSLSLTSSLILLFFDEDASGCSIFSFMAYLWWTGFIVCMAGYLLFKVSKGLYF